MTYTYLRKIFPMTWRKTYTPVISYNITVDTSSEYITNTITPFDVGANTTAVWSSSTPTRVVVTDGQTVTNIDLTLADAQTSITGWGAKVNGTTTPMVSGTAITITDDTQFVPTVNHIQLWTVSFDTSSPYITNTVTPFTVEDGDDAIYYSATPNTVSVGGTNVTMQLADEWTSITGWSIESDGVTQTLPAGTHALIIDDTEFIPTVSHVIIHKDTQGPCPNGYHIGTQSEWDTVVSALDTLGVKNETDTMNYLKMPAAYYLNRTNGSKNTSYGPVRIWTSTMSNNTTAPAFLIDENGVVQVKNDKPGNGFSIRPFKDNPMIPDSSWTTLYQGTGSAGIFWNSTLGLISISGNGTTWTTMTDKNLGATNVLDNGLFYQFGNNTGYTYNASPYVTSKPTISTDYGPGNYYTGSFVRVSSGNGWFNGTNNNLWGGVTNGTWTDPV